MNLTVTVHERRSASRLRWSTLGLGALNRTREGPNAPKVERALVDELKRALAEADPALLGDLTMAPSVRLERLALELTLHGRAGRRKKTGTFPVIVEPRACGDGVLTIAYHPVRPKEWFPVSGDDTLVAQAGTWFARCWGDLSDGEIDGLAVSRRDTLRAVSFSITPRTLLDKLESRKKDVWADLVADPLKGAEKKRPSSQVLDELGLDETERAAAGWLDAGVPRQPHRDEMQRLLSREKAAAVVLVGPPGSGKTTILNRWIYDQLSADDYDAHRNLDKVRHVHSLAGKRIIAGMSYLGDWEQRCTEILAAAPASKVTIAVPDLHAWAFIGRARGSDRNLAEFFRIPLAAREIAIVGECTPEQWQRLEDEAPSFAALFMVVTVPPATPAETVRMMFHRARAVEQDRRVQFQPSAFRTILEMGGALFPASAFPGKALELVDELSRRSAVARQDSDDERAPQAPAEVEAGGVIAVLAEKTGLPRTLLQASAPLDAAALEREFERQVRGQPAAVRAAVDVVVRIRAGLTDPRRPYAVHLLTGPTGTGKTELSKCLAEYLYGDRARLLRLDMSEYGGADAVARLIGDRWQPHGILTTRVREQPFCVVLLDEIEKAHPSVFPLLLQLFDEGRLTDAAGDVADFTHAVVLMTSNLGAVGQGSLGFGDAVADTGARARRAVQDFFSPELFNRIDRVVVFEPLTREAATGIAAKELTALLSRWGLAERHVFVSAGERPIARVVAEGFDARYGARTVKRYLEDHVGSLLVADIINRPSASMRGAHLFERDGALRLHVEALVETPASGGRLSIEPHLRRSPRELKDLLPGALDAVDELIAAESGPLAAEISARIARHNLGDADGADAVYHLEQLRLGLARVRRRLGRQKAAPMPDRWETLEALAEIDFYRRALRQVLERDQHAVVLKMTRLGLGRRETRFRETGTGLLEAMAESVLESPKTRVETAAARLADGGHVTVEHPTAEKLRGLLMRRADILVLELHGLCVLDYLHGEDGAHVWKSLTRGTEVLRVDVTQAREGGARADLDAHVVGMKAFREALESGSGALPPNPEGLRPMVREIVFDPPNASARTAALQVEDYALGYAETVQARSIAEVLPRLWMLRMSRTTETV